MRVTLKNVGALVGPVTFEPKDLTILSGGNNTGKTYAMYVLWALQQGRLRHVFSFAEPIAEQLRNEGTIQLPLRKFCEQHWGTLERGIGDSLKKRLPELFSAPRKSFDDAQVHVSVDMEKVLEYADRHQDYQRGIEIGVTGKIDVRLGQTGDELFVFMTALDVGKVPLSLLTEITSSLLIDLILSSESNGAFLLPAERGGLNLFYLDLDAKNSAVVRHLKREDSSPIDLIKDLMVAQYAEPIDAYIQFLKKAPRSNKGGGAFHDQALALQKEIARVRYKVSKDGVITAKPYRSDVELGIHLTSSTVKSFYGLWAWLEMQAKPGDCLMIDEPELNLHPENQRLIAKLLVRLVSRGVRVIVSTHSDYIVREFNNMIMLCADFPSRAALERRYGYASDGSERVSEERVAAYHFADKSVEQREVSKSFGVEIPSMDDAINKLNEVNGAIYFALSSSMLRDEDDEDIEVKLG